MLTAPTSVDVRPPRAVPETARSRLEADRSATEERLLALDAAHDEMVAASRDTNADDEHDPEGTTIAFERAQLAALRRQAVDHLAEIDAAATSPRRRHVRRLRALRPTRSPRPASKPAPPPAPA